MEINQQESQLLTSVVHLNPTAEQLDEINALIPSVENWDSFLNLLLLQGSAPLFFVKLPLLKNKLAPIHEQFLSEAYSRTLIRGMLLYNAFGEVIDALGNIPILVLKGAYLSEHLYKDIALRQFSDIDLLVHKKDGQPALEALRKIGFVPRLSKPVSRYVETHSDFVHYQPMQRNDVAVEIHIKLHNRSKDYKLSLEDIWERSTHTEIFNKKVSVMCTEDLLMHLCIHADKHFNVGKIQLKSYNDIVNLLDTISPDFNWDNFEYLCRKYKCTTVVFKHIMLANKFYKAKLPNEVVLKYRKLLQTDTEIRFGEYLRGKTYLSNEEKSAVPGHINSLRNIKNPLVFLRYLYDIILPSRKFMFDKYNIKTEDYFIFNNISPTTYHKILLKFWWLYYPYRWWRGLRGLMEMIKRGKF